MKIDLQEWLDHPLTKALKQSHQIALMSELEACAMLCEQQRDVWVDGSDQYGNPCPAKVRATPHDCAKAIRDYMVKIGVRK